MKAIEWVAQSAAERKAIKREMQRWDVSASQLAALSGVTHQAVIRYLDGYTFLPGHHTIAAMLDALEIKSFGVCRDGKLDEFSHRKKSRKMKEG